MDLEQLSDEIIKEFSDTILRSRAKLDKNGYANYEQVEDCRKELEFTKKSIQQVLERNKDQIDSLEKSQEDQDFSPLKRVEQLTSLALEIVELDSKFEVLELRLRAENIYDRSVESLFDTLSVIEKGLNKDQLKFCKEMLEGFEGVKGMRESVTLRLTEEEKRTEELKKISNQSLLLERATIRIARLKLLVGKIEALEKQLKEKQNEQQQHASSWLLTMWR